jgi:3-oxoacyl-[acyl-carrier-protein] synthase II
MASGNVAIQFGCKGKSIDVVTACATGTNSIGEAFRTIQYGDADVMITGGAEAAVTPIGIATFDSLTALTSSTDPDRCSIPFDKDRDGFVLGEGSGVLVIEELEHAKARGAKIYAEITGYGTSSDAYHITSPEESGESPAQAMLNAVNDAGIQPEEVQYINAHGTSTHLNDITETNAIKKAFGDHANDIKINSTKSMTGHLLGAAGAIEAVVCAKTIEEGYIHRTRGLVESEPELDLNYCKEPYEQDVDCVISNSLGFGGHNACLLLQKYKG